MTIDIQVPRSWQEVTQKQLAYACFLLASQTYSAEQIKTLCLLRWGHIVPKERTADGYEIEHYGKVFVIKPEQIAAFLPMMNWLLELPDVPVCMEEIQGHKAKYRADLQGLPFEQFLVLENYYQGYIRTKRPDCLNSMAAILYGKPINLQQQEAYSVFMWFAAVKQLFARRFSNFYVPAPVGQEEGDVGTNLRKAMNTQIRALTKGDITKEKEILSMDVYRALTELDAQAEEYNELKKQYNVKA